MEQNQEKLKTRKVCRITLYMRQGGQNSIILSHDFLYFSEVSATVKIKIKMNFLLFLHYQNYSPLCIHQINYPHDLSKYTEITFIKSHEEK